MFDTSLREVPLSGTTKQSDPNGRPERSEGSGIDRHVPKAFGTRDATRIASPALRDCNDSAWMGKRLGTPINKIRAHP